eukprot:TRINITY_DN56451_c0_g1_i1.p1 TRINITY_DN56451_c0_g1~~TRINITY_DN56451_c0_g1_i1.p1  ORF type:complete len:479 (+),score=95.77 TRINITY_DN56451_c0_g1_i1:69-1439(+)
MEGEPEPERETDALPAPFDHDRAAAPVTFENPEDPPPVQQLMAVLEGIGSSGGDSAEWGKALRRLCVMIRPQKLSPEHRGIFIARALQQNIVAVAVQLIESGERDVAVAACNFLADFTFGSDGSARAVLRVFERIAACFKHVFEPLTWDSLALLEAAVLLCVNIAAMCPDGHRLLVPLVQQVCVQIIRSPRAPEELRGNAITLLANLSTTVAEELRAVRVADVLLRLVADANVPGPGRSVAESVIIYLHGNQKCDEIDQLMAMDVVGNYCVPLMESTLKGEEFRGMYPHLVYSARLFQVLAQSPEYATEMLSNQQVVPLLLRVSRLPDEGPGKVESDLEGRRLSLETLRSLARLRLWPDEAEQESWDFCHRDLPDLLDHGHVGIRASASGLWATLHMSFMYFLMFVGRELEQQGRATQHLWKEKVLQFLFPTFFGTLSATRASDASGNAETSAWVF